MTITLVGPAKQIIRKTKWVRHGTPVDILVHKINEYTHTVSLWREHLRETSKYTGEILRQIRKERGIGRPIK